MMATTFQSVNASLPVRSYQMEVSTPTTPRAPRMTPPPSQSVSTAEESAPSTPTRLSFGGINGQRPLPSPRFGSSMSTSPSKPAGQPHPPHPDTLTRGSSHHSVHSVDSQDIDMDDSDEGEEGSEGESVDGESGRPSKKKKGQRFFCTDFPPCNLSFTRSEHLARHIR